MVIIQAPTILSQDSDLPPCCQAQRGRNTRLSVASFESLASYEFGILGHCWVFCRWPFWLPLGLGGACRKPGRALQPQSRVLLFCHLSRWGPPVLCGSGRTGMLWKIACLWGPTLHKGVKIGKSFQWVSWEVLRGLGMGLGSTMHPGLLVWSPNLESFCTWRTPDALEGNVHTTG